MGFLPPTRGSPRVKPPRGQTHVLVVLMTTLRLAIKRAFQTSGGCALRCLTPDRDVCPVDRHIGALPAASPHWRRGLDQRAPASFWSRFWLGESGYCPLLFQ